jgi:hypothetical protein
MTDQTRIRIPFIGGPRDGDSALYGGVFVETNCSPRPRCSPAAQRAAAW